MRKLLFALSLLLFSTNVLAEELKEYKEGDIIKTSDLTATTKDGKPLTGSVVVLRSPNTSNTFFNKAIMNYKNGELVGHLLYKDDTLLVDKKLGNKKIISMKQYYTNGNLWKDSIFQPYTKMLCYYKNGNKMLEKEYISKENGNIKIYNTDGRLIAELNISKENPYAICILNDGTKKNMSKEQYEKIENEFANQGIYGENQPNFHCE